MRKFVLAILAIVGPAPMAMGQSEPSSALATNKDTVKERSGKAALSKEQDVATAQNGDAHSGTPRNDVIEKGAKETGATEKDEAKTPVIVIGFMGGFVGHDNMAHSPAQIAAHLREAHPAGVYVKVFENRRREDAHREILNLLDINHDGKIPVEEKQKARIILYGMSWGGSETVSLARELNGDGIPVLLTVQVDSVAKVRQNDRVIPPNVSEAANFYQPDGVIHGESRIRAADEKRTRILGNFRFEYKLKAIRCEKYPWYDRVFVKYHTEIECDPTVWRQVESLIVSKLPPS